MERVHSPKRDVEVALVCKYIDLHDAYLSVSEALKAGGFANWTEVKIRWVTADECETLEDAGRALNGVDAVLVPGGFGNRGIEGKIGALHWARKNKVPTLGICLGLQCMVLEVARNILGLKHASSTEFDPDTSQPLIATMEEQLAFVDGAGDLGGTMRLGNYNAVLKDDSLMSKIYGTTTVVERHRHRYEVNNKYRDDLQKAGLHICGTSPDGKLVEFVEFDPAVHPYFVATQAHPEFRSRPTNPHPLFVGLIKAALDRQQKMYASSN